MVRVDLYLMSYIAHSRSYENVFSSNPSVSISHPVNEEEWSRRYSQMQTQDDLDRLDLKPGCEDRSIKVRYKELSLFYHPDHNKGFENQAAKVFQLILESKERLLAADVRARIHRDGAASSSHDLSGMRDRFREAEEERFRKMQTVGQGFSRAASQLHEEGEARIKELERIREAQRRQATLKMQMMEKEHEEQLAEFKRRREEMQAAHQRSLADLEKKLQEKTRRLDESVEN